MARLLLCVWPWPSHYFPMLAIAGALRERGHEVAFYTGARAREAVQGEGFACFPFQAVDDQAVDRLMFARDDYASLAGPLRFKVLLREWLVDTIPGQVADLRRVLAG